MEEHHVRLLTAAGEAWDRMGQARAVIAKDGMTYSDRFGCPKARPEIGIERDSRIAYVRIQRELGLDVAPDDARLPGLSSGRRRV